MKPGAVKGDPYSYLEEGPDGCTNWAGSLNKGYGQVWDGRTVRPAHRWFYEQQVGPIPEGMDLDHLCRNRACCNTDHLEPVTRKTNIRRGAQVDLKVVCVRGHPRTETNSYVNKYGWKQCRICHRDQERERRARRHG